MTGHQHQYEQDGAEQREAPAGSDAHPAPAPTAPAERPLVARADVLTFAATYFVVGVTVALICTTAGMAPWLVAVAAVTMYSATSQLALVAVITSGGATLAGLASALLVSARFGVLAAAIAPRLRRGAVRRGVAAHMVVDPSVALALAQPDDDAAEWVFWRVGINLGVAWLIGVVVGVVVGPHIGDPHRYGLDAVFPASLVAILAASLRAGGRIMLAVALVAGAITLTLTPLVPAGIPVLAAVLASGLVLASPTPVGAGR